MPTLTADEIKARIAAGSILGISVDTSIFDRYGCNLQYASLRKLDQFQSGQIRVILSEIVTGEVHDHIRRDAAESQRELKKAIRTHQRRWALSYSIRDWVDKDYVSLGTETEYVEEEIEFEVALTVDRVTEGEPEVIEAEVAKQRFTVDFGFVEPFRNEDPTHEKY